MESSSIDTDPEAECPTDQQVQNLFHLIYVSRETAPFSNHGLVELLERAREANNRLSVTGMLLYSEGSFLQVLEGDEDVIEKLFMAICKDQRHGGIRKIAQEAIAQRSFARWSMGFVDTTRKQLQRIKGMNDFFAHGRCLADVDDGRAKTILRQFSEGRWRAI